MPRKPAPEAGKEGSGAPATRVLSVHVGRPREVSWERGTATTSIFKAPVEGRVAVRRTNLDGDRQSDLSVHGGPEKAVYAYPSEHYPFWRRELPGTELPFGAFGENLTLLGLLEDDVRIGDRLRMGTAELVVTQPRVPCFKLGIRLGRPDVIRRFEESGRSGFYLSVAREGDVAKGDPVLRVARDPHGLTVADVFGLIRAEAPDRDLLRRASEHPALAVGWRDRFRKRLEG
ncbi:MAG TPA: MOSC domain-containing protein [Planctomycetota bacterium]|nr:MOSC domain-containing protein [Planctomycetota bacterium]